MAYHDNILASRAEQSAHALAALGLTKDQREEYRFHCETIFQLEVALHDAQNAPTGANLKEVHRTTHRMVKALQDADSWREAAYESILTLYYAIFPTLTHLDSSYAYHFLHAWKFPWTKPDHISPKPLYPQNLP